jgi:excisionase family DNA binding protein
MTLLTTKEISSILKIEPQCIRHHIRKHRIPHFRIGNRIRVELKEVLKKLENGQK